MTIKKVLCYLFWWVPAIVGTYLWSSLFLLWFFIPLVIMAVLNVSLFSGDELRRRKWSYRLLYEWPITNGEPRHINLCDVPSDVISALICYLVFYPAIAIIVVLCFLVTSLFGVRPPFLDGDPDGDDAGLVPYEKWPAIKGFKILPIYLLVLFLLVMAVDESYPYVTEFITYIWVPATESSWLGFFAVSAGGVGLLVFCTVQYIRSESWYKTRKTACRVYRSVKDKFCLVQKVVD